MNEQSEGRVEMPGFLQVLRRGKYIILVCVVLAGGVAAVFSLRQQKEYSATASLLFRDPGFDQVALGTSVVAPGAASEQQSTNLQLVTLDAAAARTAKHIGGLSGAEVKGKISVAAGGSQSDIVSITATDHNPRFAANLATTFANQFILSRRDADRAKIAGAQQLVAKQLAGVNKSSAEANTLRRSLLRLQELGALQTGNAELAQAATVPTSPSSPKVTRDILLGLLIGLLLGIALAFARARFDRRFHDVQDIEAAFARPLLATVPLARELSAADGPTLLPPPSAESFRMLRANLRYFNLDRRIRSVMVTSALPGEGKTTVATNLAAAAAEAGSRVLLIDADLRHPALGTRLGLSNQSGLATVLAGVESLEEAIVEFSRGDNDDDSQQWTFDVLASGGIPPNPVDLIESDRMAELIQEAEQSYDLVVIDTPPTSAVSDAIPLIRRVSGVIVVCRLERLTRDSAAGLRAQLENLNAPTLGVVVNCLVRGADVYGAGYGYPYHYGPIETDASANGHSRPTALRRMIRR